MHRYPVAGYRPCGMRRLPLERRWPRPTVMGILNVTPDSFSDGGDHVTTDSAVEAGLALARAGAAVVDVGGESTRPGAADVPADVEEERVVPVVERLAAAGIAVSVDTTKASVARAALHVCSRKFPTNDA